MNKRVGSKVVSQGPAFDISADRRGMLAAQDVRYTTSCPEQISRNPPKQK
jgi:hypothetical protein